MALLLKLEKNTKQIILAVTFILLALAVLSYYFNSKCVSNLTIETLVEECEGRGMELSHYIIYPNENSVKVSCKDEGIIFNLTKNV